MSDWPAWFEEGPLGPVESCEPLIWLAALAGLLFCCCWSWAALDDGVEGPRVRCGA